MKIMSEPIYPRNNYSIDYDNNEDGKCFVGFSHDCLLLVDV